MRLTERNIQCEHLKYADAYYHGISVVDVFNKLGQLEDLEEKLGVDLITMLKALNGGIKINGHNAYDLELYSENGEYWFRTEWEDKIRVMDLTKEVLK